MEVKTSVRNYPVKFKSLSQIVSDLPANFFVLTDDNVMHHWGQGLAGPRTRVVQPGEASKSLAVAEKCYEWLAVNGAVRTSTLVAFGGGVIGDLGGFVAATYMRGIDLIQVPTTLLGMVDSSVGGKVGIDLPQGKNLVGAFYPPISVQVPLETLSTLPDREYRNGMAEVIKYGAIMDADLFDLLSSAANGLETRHLVETCIRHKASVVELDEFETTGLRATLNFGHTVGHALEKVSGFQLLHGEAVAIGMVVETRIGEALGVTKLGTTERLQACLESNGLPTQLPSLKNKPLLEAMKLDKKALPGQLSFSLLTEIGRCKLCTGVPEETVLSALKN